MASGRLIDYLGSGVAASRPAAPILYPGTTGLYYATDTDVLSVWDGTIWNSIGSSTGTSTLASAWRYRSDTGITSGDPGPGDILWNNAAQASATQINLDHLTQDGVDIDFFLSEIRNGDRLVVQDLDDSANYQVWQVNATPTVALNAYSQFPVALLSSAGTGTTNFANNHPMLVIWLRLSSPDNVTTVTSAAGVANINCALGDYFRLTLTENVTSITFSGLPGTGRAATKWIEIVQGVGSYTVAWPAAFKWAGGVAGSVSVINATVDELAITTLNNGTAWRVTLAKAFS